MLLTRLTKWSWLSLGLSHCDNGLIQKACICKRIWQQVTKIALNARFPSAKTLPHASISYPMDRTRVVQCFCHKCTMTLPLLLWVVKLHTSLHVPDSFSVMKYKREPEWNLHSLSRLFRPCILSNQVRVWYRTSAHKKKLFFFSSLSLLWPAEVREVGQVSSCSLQQRKVWSRNLEMPFSVPWQYAASYNEPLSTSIQEGFDNEPR